MKQAKLENYVAYYRQYLIDYFKTSFPYTAPPTYEKWTISMGLQIDSDSEVLHLQSFLLLWKVWLVKKGVSTTKVFLKEKVDQRNKLPFL